MDSIKFNYAHEYVHVKGYCAQMCSIGDRLRAERERLGLNQEEFGQLGGVNRNSQANYEKGKRSPDAEYLAAVAKHGVDILHVVTGSRAPAEYFGLSIKESDVVANYRDMRDPDRATFERISEALRRMDDETQEKDR
ncbi:helix-turn-helix domain-containing protein [Halopseudomonas sp.]|uniref:helix-turn-helix domain-containing protein n=1 Tax=Halopseudomonas sp. TaxID=2901191 RepID=UPI003002AD9E